MFNKKNKKSPARYGSTAPYPDPEVQNQVSYFENQTNRGFTESVSLLAKGFLIITVCLIIGMVTLSFFLGVNETSQLLRGIVGFFESFWIPIVLIVGLITVIKLVMSMMGNFGLNMAKTTADAISRHDLIDGQGDNQTMAMVFSMIEKQIESSKADQAAMLTVLAAAINSGSAVNKEQQRSIREAENRAHKAALVGVSRADKQTALELRAAAKSQGSATSDQLVYDLDELFPEFDGVDSYVESE